MKYQGVIGLELREYLGVLDGQRTWSHWDCMIGVNHQDGQAVDYKSGAVCHYLQRNENGILVVDEEKLEVGAIYAVEMTIPGLRENGTYSKRELDKFIEGSNFFSDDYKNKGKKRAKRLIK